MARRSGTRKLGKRKGYGAPSRRNRSNYKPRLEQSWERPSPPMFLAPTTCADDDPPSPPPPAKRRRVRATPKAPLTPEQRTLRAKVAAHTMWSNTSNRAERTAAARKAAHDRFAKQVDPGGVLPPEERAQRAENARKAHFCRMAAASAKARAAKAAGGAPRTTRSSQGSAS